jgi:hypothetical protein
MSRNIEQFVGHLITFDIDNGDSDSVVVDSGILVEVTDFTNESEVEIAFDDRNERCYLRFSLADLAASIGEHAGKIP